MNSRTPTLNLDLCLLIMEVASKAAVAKLMATCKTFNRAGTKYLFIPPLTITKATHLLSFISFFLPPNNPRTVKYRTQFPVGLSIHLLDPSHNALLAPALTWFFTVIVPTMPHFTHLELQHVEGLLSVNPGLGKAIAALTRLEVLKVTKGGALCGDMLEAMRSSLVYAYIHLDQEADRMERGPDSLLRNSHATLRVLETHATESVHRHGTTFPGLQSLSHYDCGFPLTGQLMRICPNLRYLHINQSSGQKWPEVEEYHQSHRNSLGGEACVWTSLYKYTGSLNALYMLGLTCHISIVDIHDEKNPFTAPALRELLQDTTPSHLILRTSWTGASYYLNNGFVALMSQPGLWRWPMKTLELVITFRPADKGVNLDDMLVSPSDSPRVHPCSRI